ncbi:Ribosomal-protein-S18p-alanine acetyltransferase [hydrothermal vent metagenome]|uniref:Ribosomal-protein-S18p-alanine acetyltransferase n=1 Tax=hydrothermal vent metagenome TaxID=652676 RepID=A0A3B0RT32_9ZZZZ
MTYAIRPAGPEDAALLARLEAQSFGERSWGENNVKASFVAPRVTILLAGKPANPPSGFAMWRDLDDEAELLTIGVEPGAQRQGLAGALLEAVRKQAAEVGAARLFLEVDAGNEAALALYKAAGFEKISLRRAYYRDGADAVIMQMML